tara:strand:- start:13680 stop:14711 length:1032 start_codon:yes stop_codon:yes gene_type:complete
MVGKTVGKRVVRGKSLIRPRRINLKEFYEKRNKLLVVRAVGGLGDILMHRMMFEDFKKIMPDAEIHFACPPQYHDAVEDHPFVDKVLDSGGINRSEYVVSYITTTACGRYELAKAPFAELNRSDIWAHHCGIELTNHSMHLNITEKQKEFGKNIIEENRYRTGPAVALCPFSAMAGKNLLKDQIIETAQELLKQGCYVYGVHLHPVEELAKLNIPTICNLSIKQWMGVIDQSDYIVSVDTAAFHLAGGLKKPLVGIFTWADGKAYGKHYNFELVQKHRDNGDWDCGPCYNWGQCTQQKQGYLKPCLTELTADMILNGCNRMFQKWRWNHEKQMVISPLMRIVG